MDKHIAESLRKSQAIGLISAVQWALANKKLSTFQLRDAAEDLKKALNLLQQQ